MAATAGSVPVPTVLCVVLGTLLCLATGALAVQACRARAWCQGGSRRVGAGAGPVWGSQGSPTVGRLDPNATDPAERCPSFQAPAEPRTPSLMPSTRSWTTP